MEQKCLQELLRRLYKQLRREQHVCECKEFGGRVAHLR